MAEGREQLKANLPINVLAGYERARTRQGGKYTRFTIATLLSWQLSDEATRQDCTQIAALLDEGGVTWADVIKWLASDEDHRKQDFLDIIAKAELARGLDDDGLPEDDSPQDEKRPKTKRRKVK